MESDPQDVNSPAQEFSVGTSGTTEAHEDQKWPELEPQDILPYYDYEITEKDKDVRAAIVANRVRACTLRLKQLNKVRDELYSEWKDAKPIHLYVAFLQKEMIMDDLMISIDDPNFRKQVCDEVIEREKALSKSSRSARKLAQERIEMKYHHKETGSKELLEQEDESDDSSDDSTYYGTTDVQDRPIFRRTSAKSQKTTSTPRLPCPANIDQDEWNKWSAAKKQSYLKGMKNPNTYLYRHLPPGEEPKNGAWSKAEKELFLKRLEEVRQQGIAEGKWGIFSQAIPGRVGYQCANYYRKLVQSGVIKDSAYHKDENGQLHYKDRQPYHKKSWREKRGEHFDYEEEDEYEREESQYERLSKQNPLRRKIDFLTNEPIKVPAISIYGTVLDYNTWLQILKESKTDPITQQKINKRQITILTKENYEEYKNQIKHI